MKSQLIIYPEFDARIERDFTYSVTVTQGERTERIPVYNHTEDSRVNRNPVDDRRADQFRRFATFAFEGEGVRVDIKVNRDFRDYTVIPSAKNFKHNFENGVISVFLDKPDYFLIRLDGKDYTILSVFADDPENYDLSNEENLFVADRWSETDDGILRLTEPNTTVYIPAGAVLNARVQVLADNCKIIGRGAIVDPVGDIYRYDASKLNTGVVLLVRNASNTLIDGIHMLDSKGFNVEFIGVWEKSWAENNSVKNTKILCTQMQTDGITFCYYTRNSYAEHCFVYCGDNALVYEEYAHYRDITVGTTCNAVFPQTDVVDSSVEDVYVFRADEGIINCEYTGENGITKIENHTIKNLYATDITYTPYFLYVEVPDTHPVISARGGLTIENVDIPKLSDTVTPVFCKNIAGGDYHITLKNLFIGERLMREITPQAVGGAFDTAGHSFYYFFDEDNNDCVLVNKKTVGYKNDVNVFVGKSQVYFEMDIIKDKTDVLLPSYQLREELRAAKTVLPEYLKPQDFVSLGMAKSLHIEDNNIIFTPNDNEENLLLEDSGIISKYTEYICYASHLLVLREKDQFIYRVINTHSHSEVGIFRMIDSEIRKYGEGVYQLSFEARCEQGKFISAAIGFSDGVVAQKRFETDDKWRTHCLSVCIKTEDLDESKIALMITVGGMRDIEAFDVKNISLVKLK